MRPIKLIMSAFGPYAKRQEVDFEKLEGQNIFLITGPTGAGKTTIFDAISYALFAEASGSTREIDTLRSDFAEEDVETFVELEFEFREKVYKIRRVPKQMKKKLRGDGLTERGAEGHIELPDGKIINGYSNITTEVKDLLGIDENQFKQIVMLPQGEFKKLLLAKSSDKEEVFRKIFGTYNYQRFQYLLKEKADKIEKEVTKAEEEVKINLRGIKSFDYKLDLGENISYKEKLDEVKELINKDNDKEKEVKGAIDKIDNAIEEITIAYNKGTSINKEIKQKQILKDELLQLKSREEEFAEKAIKLDKGRKYLEILPLENSYKEKNLEGLSKSKSITNLEDNLLKVRKDYDDIISKLTIEEGKADERKELSTEIVQLEGKRSKFSELEEKKIELISLEKNNKLLIEKEAKYKSKVEEIKNEKINNEKTLEIINAAKLNKKDIEAKKESISKQIKELGTLYNSVKSYYENENIHKKEKEEYLKREAEWKKEKDVYEKEDLLYRNHQAGILAKDLVDNEPCPVCGSQTHPNKAVLTKGVLSENQLQELKKKVANLEAERNKAQLIATKKYQELLTIENDVVLPKLKEVIDAYGFDYKLDKTLLEKVFNDGTIIRGNLKILEDKFNKVLDKIKSEKIALDKKEALEKEINKIETEKETLEKEIRSNNGNLQSAKGIIDALVNELPNDVASLTVLEGFIKEKKDKLLKLENDLKNAQNRKEHIEKEKAALESGINSEKNNLIEINTAIKERETNLREAIIKVGFINYDEYNNAKSSKSDVEFLQKEIQSYKDQLNIKNELLNSKEKETDGLVEIDLSKYEEELRIKKEEKKEKEKIRNEIYSYISNNKYRYEEAKRLTESFAVKEEEYRILGELSKLTNGRVKPYITFESYVLAAYFQEILNSANIRLRKMTNERYVLKRKEDNFKGAGQKGLDLEVFDNNTGKLRNVSSLSGGETFKASLALALGLSDVIQSTAGGIKLDTMFVDEGFGTLDPESLDSAIETLLELQNDGRLVGIISHVNELKETIEKQLVVTSSSKGSSAEFI